jgi:tetratricopeptide (TPR) repeat protein
MRPRIGGFAIVTVSILVIYGLLQASHLLISGRSNAAMAAFVRQAVAYPGDESARRLAVGRAMLHREVANQPLDFESYLGRRPALPDLDRDPLGQEGGGRVTALLWRGLLLLEQAEKARALAVLRRIPDSAIYFAGLGDRRFAAGQTAEALEQYDWSQAISDDVTLAKLQMYTNLCRCDCLTADRRASWCEKVAAVREDVWGLVELGILYVQMGRHGDALRLFDEAARLDPNNPAPYAWKGNAFLATARYQDAVRAYETSVNLEPGNPWNHLGLAKAMRGANNLDGARGELETVVKLGETQTSSLARQELDALPAPSR